ncbi:MAG: alpha/beta hydrolase, partial [Streptosporangiaceae bacterium]
MLEPQSTAFFLLLMAVFGALIWWLAVAKQTVFRVLAACLAFLPAMMFGVAAVNKYYDYYQNWNAAITDLTGSNAQTPELPATTAHGSVKFATMFGSYIDTTLAAQDGYTARLMVHGPVSHLTRNVYVYLPPQYFQPSYRDYRFPVIELLHGFPGVPQDWITVIGVNTILQNLIAAGRAKPAVLVMPDVNGSLAVSLQCLNQVHGPQDATFLAGDLPTYISRILRVQPPGRAWGVAGYSEGGYCAANLGLQYATRFGYAGVLSGYFKPDDNQLAHPSRLVSPFGGNAALRRRNTPLDLVESLPPGAPVPQFWLGTGALDRSDTSNAQIFAQLVQARQPGVVLKVVPGGGHTMFTWRALISPMLEWMTPHLAGAVQSADQRAALRAAKAATGKPGRPAKPGRPVKPGRSRKSKRPPRKPKLTASRSRLPSRPTGPDL